MSVDLYTLDPGEYFLDGGESVWQFIKWTAAGYECRRLSDSRTQVFSRYGHDIFGYCDCLVKHLTGYNPQEVKPKEPPIKIPISHKVLLEYIGEIEGITLKKEGDKTSVIIHFHDSQHTIISDYSTSPNHYISRAGIASVLMNDPC